MVSQLDKEPDDLRTVEIGGCTMKKWMLAGLLFTAGASFCFGWVGVVTLDLDTRDYTLNIASERGATVPVVGTYSNYCWQSVVTCSVESVTADGWMFMGWSGDAVSDYTQTNVVTVMDTLSKTTTALFSEDADGDGLLNTNETQLGTNPRNTDSDSDGVNDPNELVAGTSPTNSASVLSVMVTPGASANELTWYGVSGRYYRLEYCDALTGGWLPKGGVIDGADTVISSLDIGAGTKRFYRIRVSDNPAGL
jgi:hypothetical protein